MSTALRVALCLALLGGCLSAAPAAAGPPPAGKGSAYTVTVIPYYSPEKIWLRFDPFIKYLREATGLPWELKLYPNHESLLAAFCKSEVSFALLGPVPLGRVVDRCNAGIAAVALGKDGRPFYHSVILTGDPTVSSLASLKGRRFAIFKGSTASHIFPLKMLKDAGVEQADLRTVFYESQDRIMNAVLSRDVAAAGVKDALYRKFQKEPLRVLATSDPLPGFAFASAPGITAEAAKAFSGALLTLAPTKNDNDRKRMESWDDEIRNGFISPSDDFRTTVLNVFAVYNEIAGEDR